VPRPFADTGKEAMGNSALAGNSPEDSVVGGTGVADGIRGAGGITVGTAGDGTAGDGTAGDGTAGDGATGDGTGDTVGIGGPPGIGVGGGASAVSGAASEGGALAGDPNATVAAMMKEFTGMRAPSAGSGTSCGTALRVPRVLPDGETTVSGRRSGAGMTAIGISSAGAVPGTPCAEPSPGGRLTPGTAKPIAAPPTVAEATAAIASAAPGRACPRCWRTGSIDCA
jgi:hypothetical protein